MVHSVFLRQDFSEVQITILKVFVQGLDFVPICWGRSRFIASLVLGLMLLFGPHAQGRVFFVTNTNDTTDRASLRGAIIDANRIGGNNLIVLGHRHAGSTQRIFRLTISGADEGHARTGDLDITRGGLIIMGASSNVVVDATGLGDRVFQVSSHARLTLSHLVIKGGTAPANENHFAVTGEPGGAIFNSGTLTIQNCFIVENSSGEGGTGFFGSGLPGGDGGGIYNQGFARLVNCVTSGNAAGAGSGLDRFGFGREGGKGGGIYNSGTMILHRCTINANSGGQGGNGSLPSGWILIGAPGAPGGAGGHGAGIYNAGQMKLNFSTVHGNGGGNGGDGGDSGGSIGNAGAGGSGAGIFNAGNLILNTSTISGNFCGSGGAGGSGGDRGNGGGIYNAGSLKSTSCTITLNGTGAAGNAPASGGLGGHGGGIANESEGASILLRNTLIALNSNDAGLSPDLAGDFTSRGYNLIGAADDSTGFTNCINADLVGRIVNPIDPLLGPLQINGGFTPTHALLPGSPAVDQGNSFGIHTDQRGHHRPYAFPSIPKAPGGDGSDIGAFELTIRILR